ncbi:MAG: LysE family transporter [Rubrobacter sp.]|nr:LysE family transporter [Rubrobacter sp.]
MAQKRYKSYKELDGTTGLCVARTVLGFSVAVPVGPIGLLCLRRTLTDGQLVGFSCGLGVASADVVYGCIAVFSLTSFSELLASHQLWLRLVGGVFLLYLGIKVFLKRPAGDEATSTSKASKVLVGAHASTFVLTITNPMTILSFAAIFRTGPSRNERRVHLRSGAGHGGVVGSALW